MCFSRAMCLKRSLELDNENSDITSDNIVVVQKNTSYIRQLTDCSHLLAPMERFGQSTNGLGSKIGLIVVY